MPDLPNHIFIAFGAITAAVIAGVFSYINLVATKESKISEFRQNWINDLRNEISKYISSVHGLIEHLRRDNKGLAIPKDRFMEKKNNHGDLYNEMLNSKISILLRINDSEELEEFKKINDKVLKYVDSIHENFENAEFGKAEEKIEKLVLEARKLLKYEWNRVRDGEKSFSRTKNIAFGTILVSVILLISMVGWKIYDIKSKVTSTKNTKTTFIKDVNASDQPLFKLDNNNSKSNANITTTRSQ